jgi:neutral ceramidase
MFKQKYGPTTWVAGYTNDVMAYIPSHRVWQEGGYEAGAFSVYGLPTERWKEDIQQRITDGVDRLVKTVQK